MLREAVAWWDAELNPIGLQFSKDTKGTVCRVHQASLVVSFFHHTVGAPSFAPLKPAVE